MTRAHTHLAVFIAPKAEHRAIFEQYHRVIGPRRCLGCGVCMCVGALMCVCVCMRCRRKPPSHSRAQVLETHTSTHTRAPTPDTGAGSCICVTVGRSSSSGSRPETKGAQVCMHSMFALFCCQCYWFYSTTPFTYVQFDLDLKWKM